MKIERNPKYPSREEIKKIVRDAFNQDNRDDIIREILYLKDK